MSNQGIEIYMEQTVDLMIAENEEATLELLQNSENKETDSGIRYMVRLINETEN